MKKEDAMQNEDKERDNAEWTIQDYLRNKPLVVLGIAAGVGFVLGGGLRTRSGRALAKYAAKSAVSSAAGSALDYAQTPPVNSA
jgi:hypothetical protein